MIRHRVQQFLDLLPLVGVIVLQNTQNLISSDGDCSGRLTTAQLLLYEAKHVLRFPTPPESYQSLSRQILVAHNQFFAVKLSDRWSKQQRTSNPYIVEIADCDDVEVYIEALSLMYCKDLRKKLMKEDVTRVLGILKAFAFSSTVKAKRLQSRASEKEQWRLYVPTIDRSIGEPAPYVVVVQGPPQVGKEAKAQFVECPNDINGMIDAAKFADLALLLIDGSYGFEMETFEFLNILQNHGFPKIMGVLTHIDKFKDVKTLKKTKQCLKHRFWTEIYDGAKLFYLSGLIHRKYAKCEVHNLARFIYVMKFHPLSWKPAELAGSSGQQLGGVLQRKRSNDNLFPQNTALVDEQSSDLNQNSIRNVVERGFQASNLYLAKKRRYFSMQNSQTSLGVEAMHNVSGHGVNNLRQQFANPNGFGDVSMCEIPNHFNTFMSPSNSASSTFNAPHTDNIDKVFSVSISFFICCTYMFICTKEVLKQGKISKPVVAWVNGTCARLFKSEVQFGLCSHYLMRPYQICVMLCAADHGPCVSGAHNTIVTARAGKDLLSSLVEDNTKKRPLRFRERSNTVLESTCRCCKKWILEYPKGSFDGCQDGNKVSGQLHRYEHLSRMAAIDESESLSDIDDVESQGAENANTEGIIAKCDTKFNKKFSTDRLSLK
ncbi:unnamed protein product [Camellia sinensis]